MLKRLLALAAAFVLLAAPHGVRAETASFPSSSSPACRTCRCSPRRPKASTPSVAWTSTSSSPPSSEELRNGLAQGRYQIAHTAIDNAFAMKDKAKVDIVGGARRRQQLQPFAWCSPTINSLADIKGKTVGVDAVNTAYAFQLYEMLRQKGLNKGDYR